MSNYIPISFINQQEVKTYQGWTNAQTWCIALTIDQTEALQIKVFEMVDKHKYKEIFINRLRTWVRRHWHEFYNMAPWVWDDFQDPLKGLLIVDWDEIWNHYKIKISEGCYDRR